MSQRLTQMLCTKPTCCIHGLSYKRGQTSAVSDFTLLRVILTSIHLAMSHLRHLESMLFCVGHPSTDILVPNVESRWTAVPR